MYELDFPISICKLGTMCHGCLNEIRLYIMIYVMPSKYIDIFVIIQGPCKSNTRNIMFKVGFSKLGLMTFWLQDSLKHGLKI